MNLGIRWGNETLEMGRKPEHDGGVWMLCEVQFEDVQGWKRILRKVHIIVSAFNGFRAM